jgi:regulatory protein
MRMANRGLADAPAGGIVTSLVAKHGRAERLVIYVDGARAFEVSAVVAEGDKLRAGDRLSSEAIQTLLAKDAPFRARERALRLIALRDRSCHEVLSRLRDAGFDDEVAAQTVEWLRDLGYLDDSRFTSHYISEKQRSGWGERRIAAELTRLGVDRQLARQALEDVRSAMSVDEAAGEGMAAVLALSRRRFAAQFATDPDAAARRLAGFLARRGFDWDTIRRVSRVLELEGGVEEAGCGDTQPFS